MTIAIEGKRLVKVYDGKVRALDGVDLKVKAGNVFALLGPNGSGKTTLMRILTTQFKPTSGEASIFGFDVVRNDAQVRKVISYVPQETSVWTDITGYENLLIYAKIYGLASGERNKIIRDALEGMGLDAVADKLIKTYSGGMIRRLEMACAMIIKPRILFLDEPTIGLDPSARKAVWEKLISFKKEYNATVFFNTHYMDEADLYSDEIAIINKGEMVMSGTADELKHSLRREVLQFNLIANIVDKNVLNMVRDLDFVNDVFMNGSELSVGVEDAETALPVVMEILRNEDISIHKISMVRPTLDDVFLKYAGIISPEAGGIRELKQSRSGNMSGKG
ncbi:MAG: ATP-binding cassette domain-containing protein [Candidatus Methanoperedens sp.]|nr:ATP-binding cassette domain-containing protein [Candidatus Methanoperedens sp.]